MARVEFPLDAQVDRTEVTVCRRAWVSLCGRYRIEHHLYSLAGMVPSWFGMVADARGGWRILGRYRRNAGALRAVRRHAFKMAKIAKELARIAAERKRARREAAQKALKTKQRREARRAKALARKRGE